MRSTLKLMLFIAIVAISVSCASKRDKEINNITKIEKQLENEGAKPDPAKLTALLDAYVAFVDNNSQDSSAPAYLYKAVNLCVGMGNGDKAMELIDRTINDFQKSEFLPETVFLKAYVYENLLSNLGQASEVYHDFLKKYPEHDLADDAEAALKYLGMSPEELVKEFEANAAKQAAASQQ